MRRLDESTQSLYSELLDLLRQAEAERVARGAPTSGSFVSKTIRSRTYWYLQRYEGSERVQHYLGPETDELLAWIERAQKARDDLSADSEVRARLCKMMAAAGAFREQAAVTKVLELLAEADVFRLGGVLLGTHAFGVYSNHLGVRFDEGMLRTQDIDVAQDPVIGVALGRETADAKKALDDTGFGFLPAPRLDPREPSTSFHVRGRQLRVDFLTPMRGREKNAPIQLPALGVAAQPLRFLEYLLEDPMQAAIVGGSGVLVRVPDPGRFALHKLWTAEKRPATDHLKAQKDRRQAAQLLEVLKDARPDGVRQAWADLEDRPGVRKRVQKSLQQVDAETRWGLEGFLNLKGLTTSE